jgi:hypothetical protein
MRTLRQPFTVFWSLLWRSVVAFPLAALAWLCALVLFASVFLLPFAALIHGTEGHWGSAALCLLAWPPLALLSRLVWRHWLKNTSGWEYGGL